MDIFEIKKKLLDTLGEIDLNKLCLNDLMTYAEIVRKASEIQEKSMTDVFLDTMKGVNGGFGTSPAYIKPIGEMK